MKKTCSTQLLLLVCCAIFFDARLALADTQVAAVQCDGGHNRILVRFGNNGGYYSEIPSSLVSQWSGVPTQEDSYSLLSCTFKNGQKISLSESSTVAMPQEGGGDTNQFFKMMINGHLVYDEKQVYQGQNISIYNISAVEYNGRSLLECNPHETKDFEGHVTANPVCYDASVRLSAGTNFLSNQERITSKDEEANPGSYYLPMHPTGVRNAP